ncbi:hypothetical protein [Nostoc sp. UHCC 0252]|uniref:hypothetical protein n=1 Tax=Nostoc sp. UHCC 0252 TaxID=3110241 RepID=UPI002B21C047|nr:hypothetical protein [Nostoc sp. UHCC 0252]MEA5604851.1 hypothetical protein [Nostoc sp. UHCC 0252]
MLAQVSSIPTTMREGFEVQYLPFRATPVDADHLKKVFGGACRGAGEFCIIHRLFCCSELICIPTAPKGINGQCKRFL